MAGSVAYSGLIVASGIRLASLGARAHGVVLFLTGLFLLGAGLAGAWLKSKGEVNDEA